jgi:hypothetical protein
MIHREKEDEFLEFDYDGFLADDNEQDDIYDNYEGETDDLFDDFDDAILDTDFSEIRGKSYKKSFGKASKKVEQRQRSRKKLPKRPIRKTGKRQKNIPVQQGVRQLKGRGERKISHVIVPSSQKVIVKGVSKFILSQNNENAKKIGYYKGKKLKQLNIIINNTAPTDFTLNLFDPSMPLDYLFSTGNNLNNKVTIAGGQVSYSDVLFNLLANPALLVKGQINVAGANVAAQNNQSLFIYNKSIDGEQEICPFNIDLQIDTMQVFSDVVYFDISKTIGRPFIPDGMDVIKYTVLAGNSVTFTFFYTQASIKKFFFKEARVNKEAKII